MGFKRTILNVQKIPVENKLPSPKEKAKKMKLRKT